MGQELPVRNFCKLGIPRQVILLPSANQREKHAPIKNTIVVVINGREMTYIKRIIHGRAEIWNLSSGVHIDIERVSV